MYFATSLIANFLDIVNKVNYIRLKQRRSVSYVFHAKSLYVFTFAAA